MSKEDVGEVLWDDLLRLDLSVELSDPPRLRCFDSICFCRGWFDGRVLVDGSLGTSLRNEGSTDSSIRL